MTIPLDITFEASGSLGIQQQVSAMKGHPSLAGRTPPMKPIGAAWSGDKLRVTVCYSCQDDTEYVMIKMAASN